MAAALESSYQISACAAPYGALRPYFHITQGFRTWARLFRLLRRLDFFVALRFAAPGQQHEFCLAPGKCDSVQELSLR